MSKSLKNAAQGRGGQTIQVRPDQIKNNAGGFVFQTSDEAWLTRFLILGTDGGTYYVSEQKLAMDSIAEIRSMIVKDENMVRTVTRDISVNGRAYKNSPAIFVTAALMVHGTDKVQNRELVQAVCRTSTHLFEFAEYIEALGGWGRAKRSAVARWYTSKSTPQLAYQAVKYRQRNGWTHRDLFRLAHPVGINPRVGNFILGKTSSEGSEEMIVGFMKMQKATSVADVLMTLREFPKLPWETIPTEFLADSAVWKELFYSGALSGQALIRNIKRLAGQDAFADSKFLMDFANKVRDPEHVGKTRLHPMQFLLALVMNRGLPGPLMDALEDGLDASFGNHQAAGKRTMFALDVSGSMTMGQCAGAPVPPFVGAAMMAMIGVRTEPMYSTMAFSGGFVPLDITKRMGLPDIIKKMSGMPFSATDCAAPMLYASRMRMEIDTFVVITDNETYYGGVHPFRALLDYRQATGINAKLVVQGMTGTRMTIANPSDPGMLDVVGMDSNTPSAVADFSAGRL